MGCPSAPVKCCTRPGGVARIMENRRVLHLPKGLSRIEGRGGIDSAPSPDFTPAETRYGAAVDVKRAADLYGQGGTLRQIGAELGIHWSTVGPTASEGLASRCVVVLLVPVTPPARRSWTFVIKS